MGEILTAEFTPVQQTGTQMDLPVLLPSLAHAAHSCLGPPGEVEREQCRAIAHTQAIVAVELIV